MHGMKNDINYRMRQWAPPPRPEWVRRLNEEGTYLDSKSIVPLDEDSLINCAKANTGLSDFGADDWYEPFNVLIKTYDEEANLSLMGRIMTRSDLIMLLEARLRVEDTYKQHPEIDDEEINSPILIIGSGRCGTSAMHNLLNEDPGNATNMQWESMFPVPPPEAATYQSDPRIDICDKRMTQWNRVTPELFAMHDFRGHVPIEMIAMESLNFQCPAWLTVFGFVPSYSIYMAQRGPLQSLQYMKRVMKLLQWKNPRQRWLLKSPDAMRYLPDVFKVFPDLRLIWMHRDPLKAVSSMVNLIGTLTWIRSDHELDENTFRQITNPAAMAAMLEQGIDWIENGEIPRQQVCNVHYQNLIANPLATIEMLYQHLGILLTDEARRSLEAYVRDNPRDNRPTHQYATGDAARLAEERKVFDRYQSYFEVKSEF